MPVNKLFPPRNEIDAFLLTGTPSEFQLQATKMTLKKQENGVLFKLHPITETNFKAIHKKVHTICRLIKYGETLEIEVNNLDLFYTKINQNIQNNYLTIIPPISLVKTQLLSNSVKTISTTETALDYDFLVQASGAVIFLTIIGIKDHYLGIALEKKCHDKNFEALYRDSKLTVVIYDYVEFYAKIAHSHGDRSEAELSAVNFNKMLLTSDEFDHSLQKEKIEGNENQLIVSLEMGGIINAKVSKLTPRFLIIECPKIKTYHNYSKKHLVNFATYKKNIITIPLNSEQTFQETYDILLYSILRPIDYYKNKYGSLTTSIINDNNNTIGASSGKMEIEPLSKKTSPSTALIVDNGSNVNTARNAIQIDDQEPVNDKLSKVRKLEEEVHSESTKRIFQPNWNNTNNNNAQHFPSPNYVVLPPLWIQYQPIYYLASPVLLDPTTNLTYSVFTNPPTGAIPVVTHNANNQIFEDSNNLGTNSIESPSENITKHDSKIAQNSTPLLRNTIFKPDSSIEIKNHNETKPAPAPLNNLNDSLEQDATDGFMKLVGL